MDSEEEPSIDSDELHDRRTTKRPAKKPAARRRKARPLPDSVKKQFLNDVEAIGSYHQIGKGKRFSVTGIVAQRPALYEQYLSSLQNLIYYFRRRKADQYRQILDEYQVTPFAFRSNSSTIQDFDSEPVSDSESNFDETSPRPRPRTMMQPTGGRVPPRVPPGANARAAGRSDPAPTHVGTFL
jgi:hypothetical protein